MNKKFNTFLFIVSATVVNIILMSVLFVFAYAVYQIVAGRHFSPGINTVVVFLLFAGSVVLTYIVHKRLVIMMAGRIDMEKYFHPILRLPKKGAKEKS